jgi:hypothetical protein
MRQLRQFLVVTTITTGLYVLLYVLIQGMVNPVVIVTPTPIDIEKWPHGRPIVSWFGFMAWALATLVYSTCARRAEPPQCGEGVSSVRTTSEVSSGGTPTFMRCVSSGDVVSRTAEKRRRVQLCRGTSATFLQRGGRSQATVGRSARLRSGSSRSS